MQVRWQHLAGPAPSTNSPLQRKVVRARAVDRAVAARARVRLAAEWVREAVGLAARDRRAREREPPD